MAGTDPNNFPDSISPNRPPTFEHELDDLFAEINALSLVLNRAAHSEYPGGELSASEKSVLQILERSGPLTVPEIARVRSTSRQNVQILVNRLNREGSVEMVTNPAHKRSVLLRLTVQGRKALSAGEQQQMKLAARLRAAIITEEVTAATRVLREFRRKLDEQEHPANNASSSSTRGRPMSPDTAVAQTEEPQAEDYELPVSLL